jgi:hypothetical protein
VLASHEVKVSPEWQEVRFAMVPNEADPAARLSFSNLGLQTGEFAFRDISLRPGGIVALRDGEKLGAIPFFKKSEVGARTLAAQRDWNHFIYDTEAAYWPGMSKFIKGDLKARSLVLGSATGFSPWPIQAMLDVVDAHSYWQHPHFPGRAWDMDNWTLKNESMAGAPDGGALTTLAMRRVAGKPFIVTEYNHASPNTYSSEGFLEVCALAALQDWDGIFAFAYSHRLNDWNTGRITSFFDIDQHPTKMATLPAALAMFYRADVRPPEHDSVVANVTFQTALESIRKGSSWVEARAYGIEREQMFQEPVGMRLGTMDSVVSQSIIDDAGKNTKGEPEFLWDTARRRMVVKSSRTVAVVGKVTAGETIESHGVKITPGATMQDWATITLTAFDGDSLEQAGRILVTATGYAGNVGMKWKDAAKTSVGTNWGQGPSVVEGIPMTISIPSKHLLKAWMLDERGQRKNSIPVHKGSDGVTVIELSPEQKTLWWELAKDEARK